MIADSHIDDQRQRQRQDIQGLRAIAALAVILFHATDRLPGGFLGVDVFFVISGFIMTELARAEIAESGTFSPARFLERRCRRLLPPMAVVVLTTILLGSLIDTPQRMSETLPLTGLSALTGLANFHFVSQATDYFESFHASPLLNLWSLAVEIQFYALFAASLSVALALGRRLQLSPSRSIAAFDGLVLGLTLLSLLAALSIPIWHLRAGTALPGIVSFFHLPTRLWEFGCGVLTSLAGMKLRNRIGASAILSAAQMVSLLVLLLSFRFGSNLRLVPGHQAILPCLATALLLLGGDRGPVGGMLAARVLTFLGDRSYSIYLWQGPLVVFAATLFATPLAMASAAIASILVAILTYDTVESAFRRRRRHSPDNLPGDTADATRRPWWMIPAAAYAATLLACTAAHLIIPATVGRLAAPRPIRATELDKACARQRGTLDIAPCVYGDARGPKVLLIGDSHAGALSQAVVDAATRLGWQSHVATASACAVPEYARTVAYRESCRGYTAAVLTYARQHGVSLVVLQQFSAFYVTDLGIGLDDWRRGLTLALQVLAESGIPTLVIGDNLSLPLHVGRPLWAQSWDVDLSDIARQRDRLDASEQEVATSVPDGRYLSAKEHLCRANMQCPVFADGTWLYTDRDHLSFRGAARLIPSIEAELRAVAPK